MSLLDIYKAKLGIGSRSLFDTVFAKRMDPASYETVIDKVPYRKRQTANGANVSSKCVDTIVGGSIAWNQLVQNGNFADTSGWSANNCSINASDNVLTITPTDYSTNTVGIYKTGALVVNHKCLLSVDVNPTSDVEMRIGTSQSVGTFKTISGNAWTNVSSIIIPDKATLTIYGRLSSAGWSSGELKYKNVQVFDLTQMFGSAIADYIYTLEQNTVGSGVAYFRKLFSKAFYPYDPGTLMSVNASAHIMRDVRGNIIGNYELDNTLTLRGVPKLDASNKLYYEGDTYESDGTVTRRFRTVTFNGSDSEVWKKEGSSWNTRGLNVYYLTFSNSADNAYFISDNDINNAISNKWTIASVMQARTTDKENIMTFTRASGATSAKYIEITTSAADVTAWKASLQSNPVTVVYELATPITETAGPYQNPQNITSHGSEEYVDNAASQGLRAVSMPTGHNTTYKVRI